MGRTRSQILPMFPLPHPTPKTTATTVHRMLPPHNDKHVQNGDIGAELNRFRPYLQMLARMQFDDVLQAKLDESDIVQQTLMEAHQSLGNFRGTSDREKAAWLRRILARNLADEL